ncbi:hypothetical protein [Ligaoa zhengdingensis]|uniref:hypothetical protein n=1 Tax=Ligaoa zhengdingensis TaxID=2763658 RepID=UPI0031BA5B65
MKKVLATILALTMALGMTTVAMAASKTQNIVVDGDQAYTYDADDKELTSVTNPSTPGKTYYYLVKNNDGSYNNGKDNITSPSALSNYRLKKTIDEGAKAVDSISFVTKTVEKVDGNADHEILQDLSSKKLTFIAVRINDSYVKTDFDVDMEIYVIGRSDYKVTGVAADRDELQATIYFDYNFSYDTDYAKSYMTIYSNQPIINFDDIDDSEPITLWFADADGDLRFEVNAKGQKELFLRYNDDEIEALTEKYPNATLEFHTFEGNNKTFKRSGKLYIPADEIELKDGKMGAPYLYEIVNGKITAVEAKYDSYDEEFVISTNKLGSYVVSDTKLKTASSDDNDDDDNTTNGGGTSGTGNPDTGANDVVGIAVALAVVSVAAISAASFKKRTK